MKSYIFDSKWIVKQSETEMNVTTSLQFVFNAIWEAATKKKTPNSTFYQRKIERIHAEYDNNAI